MSDGPSLLLNSPIIGASVSGQPAAEAPCSEEHQVELLKKQLQQQEQQALAASAQVLMPFCHLKSYHKHYFLPQTFKLWNRCFPLLICLSLMVKRCFIDTSQISLYCFPHPAFRFCGCHSHTVSKLSHDILWRRQQSAMRIHENCHCVCLENNGGCLESGGSVPLHLIHPYC